MLKRTAITIPEAVLEEVDRVARSRGESRSRFITEVLQAALRVRRDADITARLDALFEDEALASEQRRVALDLAVVGAELDDEGW